MTAKPATITITVPRTTPATSANTGTPRTMGITMPITPWGSK